MTLKRGSLVISGSGITAISHLTVEAMIAIKSADIVYHVIADVVTEAWIAENSKEHRSLKDFYIPGQHRRVTYDFMKSSIVDQVKKGDNVCAVFYGHPGVFVNPSHAAARELSALGYQVTMQSGISAEDCLFSDIGIDPATRGCYSIEATNLLIHRRELDTTVPLVVWQIGMVGDPTYNPNRTIQPISLLVEKLRKWYPKTHMVCVYEAALYDVSKPRMDWVELGSLEDAEINGISTLFIPQLADPELDGEYMSKLGLVADTALGFRSSSLETAANKVTSPFLT